jgi:multidrug efflux pump subunit AcrA (membrane-fusion protein)
MPGTKWRRWKRVRGPLLACAFGLLAGLGIGAERHLARQERNREADAPENSEGAVIYTCSMDPQIRWDHPGRCPICSMALIPVLGEKGMGLRLPPRLVQLAGIRSEKVVRKPVPRFLRAMGFFEADETRRSEITAWVHGRADRLHPDYTGLRVRRGDPLAEVYSPDLLEARDELEIALESVRSAADPERAADAATSLEAARLRLKRMGLGDADLERLESGRASGILTTLRAPAGGTILEKTIREGEYFHEGRVLFRIADLSVLWLVLHVFEEDLDRLHSGQKVVFETPASPGERRAGFITFIDPDVDPDRRTIRVRVPVSNADRRLKPGMFARAVVEIDADPSGVPLAPRLGAWVCPHHPEVLSNEPGVCPVCGQALEAIPAPGALPEIFSCPMECGHFDHDGPCPVCGMAMEELPSLVETIESHVCLLHPGKESGEPGPCPEDGRPRLHLERRAGRAIALARGSVLRAGSRRFVYVETGEGEYGPRQVEVGPGSETEVPLIVIPQSGRIYAHLKPVRPGDRVVTRGAFFLDSRLQLQGKLSLFDPDLPALRVLAPAERFLNDYFALRRVLAGGRTGPAPERFARMLALAADAAAAETGRPDPGRRASEAARRAFHRARKALEGREVHDLESARQALASLGPAVKRFVQEVHASISGAEPIRLFRDPDDGRLWAQRDASPGNPYRGPAGADRAVPLEDAEPAGAPRAGGGTGHRGHG